MSNTSNLSDARAAGAARSRLPEHPARVLIADDEHLVASGLAGSLRELGYAVAAIAADGEEAIECCRNMRPDLALLDIRMPKLDGLAAAEIIFRQFNIPTVIISAYSDPDYVDGANRAGVFGYLLKPVSRDQMQVSIALSWGRFLDHAAGAAEVSQLRERLEQRKTIEQAKWLIVERKGVTEPDAMRLLQRQARNNRRTLHDVARSVLENAELFIGELK